MPARRRRARTGLLTLDDGSPALVSIGNQLSVSNRVALATAVHHSIE